MNGVASADGTFEENKNSLNADGTSKVSYTVGRTPAPP